MKTRLFALAALACLASACASGETGRQIPRDSVNAITRGVTTTQQVQAVFGDPDSRSVAADGSEAWGYNYTSSRSDGRVAQALCPALVTLRYILIPLGGLCNPVRTEQELTLAFDAKQTVASYTYSNREINLADRARDPRSRGPYPYPGPSIPVIYGGPRVASETR